MEKQHLVFIMNPKAGTGKRNSLQQITSSVFEADRFVVSFLYTQAVNHARELAGNAATSGCSAVIAVGGDGTVNEVAGALTGTKCPMGIIPTGSGNGLARHHKIPFDFRKALGVIKRNNQVPHDAARINGQLSFNVSGIGFDAHVAHLFGKNGKRGFSSYMKLVIKEFNDYRNIRFAVNENHQEKEFDAALIAIATASQFGNNALISPASGTNDGITNLTIVRKMSWLGLPFFMSKVFSGNVARSGYVSLMAGTKFIIRSPKPVPLHIDGEEAGSADRFNIETIPNAIRLIVP